jgi:hypothetical protein
LGFSIAKSITDLLSLGSAGFPAFTAALSDRTLRGAVFAPSFVISLLWHFAAGTGETAA